MRWLPRLVKPKRFSLKYRGEVCLNCEHPLDVSERFCPNCGQRNSTKKITLKDLTEELLSSFCSYDSRLWQSLKLMFFKPGALPLAYTKGQRYSYTNPFRFFLSIAIIFFLVVSQFVNEEDFDDVNFMGVDELSEAITPDSTTTASALSSIQEQVNKTEQKGNLNKEDAKVASSILDSLQSNLKNKKTPIVELDKGLDKSLALQKAFKENPNLKFEEALSQGFLKDNFRDLLMYRLFRGLAKTQQSVAGFISFLLPKIPFFIFFFVPVFSVFYLLLFIGAGKSYVDHMVYNFSLSSFLLIIIALYAILNEYWTSNWFEMIIIIGIFFYTYKSIRKFYGHGRIVSFLKAIFISFLYPVTLFLFLVVLTLMSFTFY